LDLFINIVLGCAWPNIVKICHPTSGHAILSGISQKQLNINCIPDWGCRVLCQIPGYREKICWYD